MFAVVTLAALFFLNEPSLGDRFVREFLVSETEAFKSTAQLLIIGMSEERVNNMLRDDSTAVITTGFSASRIIYLLQHETSIHIGTTGRVTAIEWQKKRAMDRDFQAGHAHPDR